MQIDKALYELGKELKNTRTCIEAVIELLESDKLTKQGAADSLKRIIDDLPQK